MKFFISFLIINVFIIDGVQNVPVIHPIHVQTVPLHSITVRSTSADLTTRNPIISPIITTRPSQHLWWFWSSSTHFTNLIPSSNIFTIHYHRSSWWDKAYPTVKIILYVFLGLVVIAGTCKILENLCCSPKQQKPSKKSRSFVVQNKMCVSTIDGTREASPPSYVEVHDV
ncbi:unnamed protein product [Rotaria sp. Silwood2]|nr:unnamed protein product [Rotaria sp. Silwood2]CAF3900303.1 unnamed protein product [Rotaria sp. Silwood2]